jgi:hypothetical protein
MGTKNEEEERIRSFLGLRRSWSGVKMIIIIRAYAFMLTQQEHGRNREVIPTADTRVNDP